VNLELIKKHPYATGGVVIVGGLFVFYLLSRSQGSNSTVGAGQSGAGSSTDYAPILSYNAQIAQIQAAQSQQQTAANVQLQQYAFQADIANKQTDASLEANNVNTAAQLAATLAQFQATTQQNRDTLEAQTTQSANQLMYAQNIQQMQDAVLESQINAGVVENANNNATALAGTEATLNYQSTLAGYQAAVGLAGVDAAKEIQLAQNQQQYDLSDQVLNMVQQAGLNHGTQSLEASLVGLAGTALGYPQVGVAGVTSGSAAAIASSQATANIIQSLAQVPASIVTAARV
jgi:hypothetical protein